MKIIDASLLLTCVLVAACGGGGGGDSGVDENQAITDLDTAEVSTFCEWLIEISGGENQITECDGGFTWSSGTVADCETGFSALPADCSSVTVAEMEACAEVIAEDPCTGVTSELCAEYFACVSDQ